jgi:GT2 family glycosyltransferase
MTDLAIIIVNWNVRDLLAACLRTVLTDLAAGDLSGQIWVVDNASHDGSVAMLERDFPQVRLLTSAENLGFAGGNNAALRAMGFGHDDRQAGRAEAMASVQTHSDLPKVVLLLNPDTKVQPGALQTLVDFLAGNARAGVAGARLVYGDGSFQHSVFAFPGLWQLAIELLPLPGRLVESRLNGRYPRLLYERGRPFKVGHPLGAAMGVRGEAIEQVGLLDERYHMYVEEIDWCRRIVAAGWEAFCVPAAVVTHFGGQSTGQIQLDSMLHLWTSRYRFYHKHYHPVRVWLAGQIVRIGMERKAAIDATTAGQGKLTEAELANRRRCYQRIIDIWRGKHSKS